MKGLLSMQKVNSSFILKVLPRACLIFLICLSLVAFTSYTAPKAQAEALTLTLTSAFLLLAISVMSTLGVLIISRSNDDAVDYMTVWFDSFLRDVKGFTGSISEYLSSIGLGAIGLFGAPIHGAISIGKLAYDLIAEFCTWYFAKLDVESDGDPVGDLGGGNVTYNHTGNILGSFSLSVLSPTALSFTCTDLYTSNNGKIRVLIPVNHVSNQSVTYTFNYSDIVGTQCQFEFGVFSNNTYYETPGSTHTPGYGSYISSYSYTAPSNLTYDYLALYIIPTTMYQYRRTCSITATLSQAEYDYSDGSFTLTPSDNVIAPPSIAVGQTYNVPADGVTDTTTMEDAISTAIAPLTTAGGLSTTGTVVGTAIPAEYEWLYEDTQAIRNNTNPHFDFIPDSLGFDFSIWHYVTEMMNAVSDSFALLGTFISNMPPAVLVFPFGVFALCITVALFRRFLS